jgi:hypothetical protein
VLYNAGTTTDLTADAEIIVGPFGTNGGNKVYTVSYEFGAGSQSASQVTYSSSAEVRLYRKIGSTETHIATLNASGSVSSYYDSEFNAWVNSESFGGSTTYTDNDPSTSPFTLRAELHSRSVYHNLTVSLQKITVTSTEE